MSECDGAAFIHACRFYYISTILLQCTLQINNGWMQINVK